MSWDGFRLDHRIACWFSQALVGFINFITSCAKPSSDTYINTRPLCVQLVGGIELKYNYLPWRSGKKLQTWLVTGEVVMCFISSPVSSSLITK